MQTFKSTIIYDFSQSSNIRASQDISNTLSDFNIKPSIISNTEPNLINYLKNTDFAFVCSDSSSVIIPQIKSLLEFFKVSNVLPSYHNLAITTQKQFLYKILSSYNIPIPTSYVLNSNELKFQTNYPAIIEFQTKNQTIISEVDSFEEYKQLISISPEIPNKILVRKKLQGTVIFTAFINGIPQGLAESIESRSNSNSTYEEIYLPPRQKPSLVKTAETLAHRVVHKLNLSTPTLVKCLITNDNKIYITDIDINPSLGRNDIFVRILLSGGFNYKNFILDLLTSSVKKLRNYSEFTAQNL